ncbi:C-terminal four TMM region of protein-O-mannosyltransferase [Micrococcales bacterium KH10]|nr:C-terminal four TMM region of protein-O-mannosyltransferase [Micrococcales bacterium KH10]
MGRVHDLDEPAAPEVLGDTSDEAQQNSSYQDHLDRFHRLLFRPRELALGSTAHDRLWGWLGPALVTLLGGLLRLINLGNPAELVFDETYYVKDGYALIELGYEARWPDDANDQFAAGQADLYSTSATYTVHPQVGKLLIGWGIRLGGVENPWAWRLATALLGTAAIFVLARTARRILGSTVMGTVAGGLLALDGMGIVLARTALLDGILMFFIVVAFACLVADRFQSRHRLAARAATMMAAGGDLSMMKPGLGWRWWRLAAGVSLGLACGTKWSGFYALAVFGIVTVWWDLGARRAVAGQRWGWTWLVRDAIPAFGALVPTALVTYVASWWSWFAHPQSWGRLWHTENPAALPGWLPDGLQSWWDVGRSWWHHHATMLDFHATLDDPHRYQANPYLWPLQVRPTSFYWEETEGPCGGSDTCVQVITSLGNPLLWWLAVAAFGLALWRLIHHRDWRAGAVIAGYCAVWVPWFFFAHRTIFTFYMVALAPFAALAVAYAAQVLLERCTVSPRDVELAARTAPGGVRTRAELNARRRVRVAARRLRHTKFWFAAALASIAAMTLFFYPIWTAWNVPYLFWLVHMWSPTWI